MAEKKTYQKKQTLAENASDFNKLSARELPNDIELEKALLGGLMVYYNSIISVAPVLKETDFYSERCAAIYSAILRIFNSGQKVETLSVIIELRKTKEIEFVGGASFIARLTQNDTTEIYNSALYLVELSRKRQLIQLTQNIAYKSYDLGNDVFELIGETQSGILELLDFSFGKETHFGAISQETYKQITSKRVGELEGMPSKFRGNNELTGGYRKGTLRTIAARPGVGKSTHLANEVAHLAGLGYNVMIFSLEMPASEVVKRLMSISTQIEGWKLDKNQMSNSELEVLQKFVSNSTMSSIHIDDSAGVDFLYIASQIKKVKMKNEISDNTKSGLDIAFIDYVQIMKISHENRNIGLGEITRSLKTLSKELNMCIVIYSQLNRSVETRAGDKRPILSDLKESGSIEEDSDVVEFLYRAEMYGMMEDEKGESTVGVMEIITSKNRQGALDTTKVKLIPTISTLLEHNYSKKEDFTPKKMIGSISDFENQVPEQIDKLNF